MKEGTNNQLSLERLKKGGINSLSVEGVTVTSYQGCDFKVHMLASGDCIEVDWIPQEGSNFKKSDIQAKLFVQLVDCEIVLDCDYKDSTSLSDLKSSSVEQILAENELTYNARRAALDILNSIGSCSSELFASTIAKFQAQIEEQAALQKQVDTEQKKIIDTFASRHVQLSESDAKSIVKILKRQADERAVSETIQVLQLGVDGKTSRKGLHCAKTGTNQYFWFQADGNIVPEVDVNNIIATSWKEKEL